MRTEPTGPGGRPRDRRRRPGTSTGATFRRDAQGAVCHQTKARQGYCKEMLMSSSSASLSTPEGPLSVSGAPSLPAGFTDTFTTEPTHADGGTVGCGLPPRPRSPLLELRSMLLRRTAVEDPATGFAARDAARRGSSTARNRTALSLADCCCLGCGVQPGGSRDSPGDTCDLDCEVLAGFVEAVAVFDAARRCRGAAVVGAYRAR
jgi:hypothetical protein